ncbi:MAG: GNAT family N-acetyltransferase [bacterium]|nr:GNAT family N-acetyltransferase [bacterium]
MYNFVRLNKENIGLAFSCTRDHSLWGSDYHQKSNKFLIDNLNYRIYGIGAVHDMNPIGHALLVDAKGPISPVDSKNGLYLHCIYISPNHRNREIGTSLLEEIEKEAKNEKKDAIFLSAIGMHWMSRGFFEKNGFTTVNEDDLDATLMKSFSSSVEYRIIKDVPKHQPKTNQLVINHNPLCPLMLYRYSMLAKMASEEIEGIEIMQNTIEDTSEMKTQMSYGVYFNNLPILVNEKQIADSVAMIKSLVIKI